MKLLAVKCYRKCAENVNEFWRQKLKEEMSVKDIKQKRWNTACRARAPLWAELWKLRGKLAGGRVEVFPKYPGLDEHLACLSTTVFRLNSSFLNLNQEGKQIFLVLICFNEIKCDANLHTMFFFNKNSSDSSDSI